MPKLKQTFGNPTNAPLFINLELSTARFRVNPGEELILFYDPDERAIDEHGAVLKIELVKGQNGAELVVWTSEQEMFHPDGRVAVRDYGEI
jgi:hypothetical protein